MLAIAGIFFYICRRKHVFIGFFRLRDNNTNTVFTQLAALQERTLYLQGLEEKIESIRSKQDSDSRELREKLYGEYSKKLHDAVELLRETYGRMSEITASAFREATDRNVEIYRQTVKQLINMAERLESAFKLVEQKEHAQMREEMNNLKRKLDELQRDPLRVQLEEIAEAKAAQAIHEESVRKLSTLFWTNNGEVKFKERIGQYEPDVLINNHKLKIVADEVTTENLKSIRDKIKQVADYMQGLNANLGYVVIPNTGIDTETLREIKRTVPMKGLYVVRMTEYALHLQVWRDIVSTGMIATEVLVEKGANFLQILEPIFDEFLAIVQKIEQKDEQDFKYRQNRFKEIKMLPMKMLNALENSQNRREAVGN
jgi:hypothetical protein